MKQQIVRIVMATAVLMGCAVSVNAQFGGLLNKAKRTAEQKATNAIYKQTQSSNQTQSPEQTTTTVSEGDKVLLYYASGNPRRSSGRFLPLPAQSACDPGRTR